MEQSEPFPYNVINSPETNKPLHKIKHTAMEPTGLIAHRHA